MGGYSDSARASAREKARSARVAAIRQNSHLSFFSEAASALAPGSIPEPSSKPGGVRAVRLSMLAAGRMTAHESLDPRRVSSHLSSMARRPRPKIVTLTDAAAARVRELMSEKDKGFLRVGVTNGGCAGMEYVMDYAEAPEPLDEVVEDNGVQIVVDAKAVLFLLGSQVDFEVTPLHEKFVFSNPNQTDACGCGESVTIVPAAAE